MTTMRTATVHTRRRLAAVGLSGISVILAACGGDAPAAPAKPEAAKPEPTKAPAAAPTAAPAPTVAAAPTTAPVTLKAGTTITFWNDMGGPYPGLMEKWRDQFGGKTQVKVEVTGGMGDFTNKLTAAFAAGTPPDLYRYLQEAIPLPAAVERNMLKKLDDLIKRDKVDLADFRKDSIVLYQWKGSQLALPRDYGLQLVYYNTEVFSKAGVQPIPIDWAEKTWTFDKFLATCQAVMRGGAQYALIVNRGWRPWASWVYSNGGAVVKRDGEGMATEFAIAEKPAIDALQFLQDLIYKHKVAPTPEEEATLGDQLALIQSGKVAMRFGNPGDNSAYKPTGMPYDVGVFPLGPSGTKRGTGGGGTGWAISGPTKQPEEAWAFLQMITSKEAQLGEVGIGQTTPSRTSVATSPEYLAGPPKGTKAFGDGQDYVVRDPVHAKWPDAQREAVAKIMNEQFWTGKTPATQVAKDVKERGDAMLKG
jgi:multiple sugar transport system substrate-binding protein